MTFYEQIQLVLDEMESNLGKKMSIGDYAGLACMSEATFYRYFTALTGFSVKEYLRRRRLSVAAESLKKSQRTILDIALEAGYESHESFTRAFQREFGINPSSIRKSRLPVRGINRKQLIEEQYMGILIKELHDRSVAYYRVISKSPERDAWNHIKRWSEETGLFDKPYRIFGYNNPSPEEMTNKKDREGNEYPATIGHPEYGYEFMITVDSDYPSEEDGRGVDFKTMKGGRFAVMSIGVGCEENDIAKGWGKFNALLKEGGYKAGGRWYEEHLDFDISPENPNWRMDLYVEIE
ncbi:AraC family transcriptional regulator [Spirochaeta isovalerica]|uniref:AraC family transcriptional regulator n=1 Tax=Spirochaeta isovalerica TaxID=150 RepID=A0A841RCJ3_9SPIO|nr:helix-turn-helix domain-containing protein [Spirochaeta isovalerica]MBB6481705.1 AraC family transcriptional regulator [Spirochaeta isovalerica]